MDQTFADGSSGGPFFTIQESGVVTLTDLTVRNGGNSSGGVILNDGTVYVSDCLLRDNLALFAGGIMNRGTMIVADSTLRDNSATWESAGGIMNAGTLTVTRGILIGNTAHSSGGAIENYGRLTVIHSTLISNTAQSGGAIANWSGVTTLEDSIVMSNTATSPCCAGEGGGGIWNRTDAAMTIRRSTISANSTTQDDGGGIANQGSLELLDSTLSNNSAAISGGALFAITGTMTINGVTFYNNRGQQWDGGAIDNNGAVLTLTNSTFSGNTAVRNGGAIATDGHSNPNRLTNVTVVSNTTAGDGGGIYAVNGQLFFQSSILAHNSALGGIGADCAGLLNSLDYNLIEESSGCVIAGPIGHTIIGQDPVLGPLQDNGGSTFTHALLEGSPAIDSGGDTCPDTDQRGVPRPQDGNGDGIARCDMGAFELAGDFSVFLPLIQR